MTTYQIEYQGTMLDMIHLCKRIIVANSGKIKMVDTDNGLISSVFTYGINLNGLKADISITPTDEKHGYIAVSAEFKNSADITGVADKKAAALADKISQAIQELNTSSQISDLHYLQTALTQVKQTSIMSWTIIVLIALCISAIPTGFGILLVPLIGLVGAIIGLPFSRWLVKRAHNVKVISQDNTEHSDYFWLHDMVSELAQKANIPTPEIGIYESLDMNAFASGATPNSSVVAFSTALIEKMTTAEIEAIAAHEIGHIISNDMRGMAILTGLVSSFVLVFTLPLQGLRIINSLSNSYSTLIDIILWITKALLSIVFTFLGSLVVKKYSRMREYKADAIAALLVGKEPIIRALSKLEQETEAIPVAQRSFNAFKISSHSQWAEIFSTHPSIENRIQALKFETHSST